MTGEEIKKAIDNNNSVIESILVKESFVLNPQITFLVNSNEELRTMCPHEYDEDGICKFCLTENK